MKEMKKERDKDAWKKQNENKLCEKHVLYCCRNEEQIRKNEVETSELNKLKMPNRKYFWMDK